MTSARPPALEARGIVKRFPGVLANDHVDLVLPHGQVWVALVPLGSPITPS